MSQDVYLDCYRAALHAASVELSDIVKEFDQLRQRKDQVQKVVLALKPIAGLDEHAPAPPQQAMDRAAAFIEWATTPSPEPVQETEDAAQYGFMEVAEKLSPRVQASADSWSNLPHRPAMVA